MICKSPSEQLILDCQTKVAAMHVHIRKVIIKVNVKKFCKYDFDFT